MKAQNLQPSHNGTTRLKIIAIVSLDGERTYADLASKKASGILELSAIV